MQYKIHLFAGLLSLLLFSACNNQSSTKTTTVADSSNVTANWKIGVQLWTFRMFTQAEALAKVDSAGVKNVEAFFGQAVDKNSKDTFGLNLSDSGRLKLKGLLAQHGIQMVAMGVIAPKNREEWIKAFELAKYFGLSYITSEPVKTHWDMIDSLAGTYAIKIAIHEHPKPNVYWHPDSVLVAISGHKNIGACADLGHWARSGLSVVDCLKKLDGHIYGVHLKDIVTFNDTKAADTVVGKGVIDFKPIFSELKRQNFKGMFSIEHESNWFNNLQDVKETVKFYDDHVAALNK